MIRRRESCWKTDWNPGGCLVVRENGSGRWEDPDVWLMSGSRDGTVRDEAHVSAGFSLAAGQESIAMIPFLLFPVTVSFKEGLSPETLSYTFPCDTFWGHTFFREDRAFVFRSGGVAERSKAAVLKTVERKLRGFESYPLRQILISLPERWPSGRRRPPAKRMWGLKPHPGFESLPLRQFSSVMPERPEKNPVRF